MALTTPIASAKPAFDATKAEVFTFDVKSGDTVTKNRLTIVEQSTNSVVYQKTTSDGYLVYNQTLPANKLTNGTYYYYYFNTYNVDGDVSLNSNIVPFYCYTTPVLKVTNYPTSSTVLQSSNYTFNITYSQAENELMDYMVCTIYKDKEVWLQSDKIKATTDNNYYYTAYGLTDGSYNLQVDCYTINNTKTTLKKDSFTVKINAPILYSRLDVQSKCDKGYVDVYSYLTDIQGESSDTPVYIDNNTRINLLPRQKYVRWTQGVNIPSNFTLGVWGNIGETYQYRTIKPHIYTSALSGTISVLSNGIWLRYDGDGMLWNRDDDNRYVINDQFTFVFSGFCSVDDLSFTTNKNIEIASLRDAGCLSTIKICLRTTTEGIYIELLFYRIHDEHLFYSCQSELVTFDELGNHKDTLSFTVFVQKSAAYHNWDLKFGVYGNDGCNWKSKKTEEYTQMYDTEGKNLVHFRQATISNINNNSDDSQKTLIIVRNLVINHDINMDYRNIDYTPNYDTFLNVDVISTESAGARIGFNDKILKLYNNNYSIEVSPMYEVPTSLTEPQFCFRLDFYDGATLIGRGKTNYIDLINPQDDYALFIQKNEDTWTLSVVNKTQGEFEFSLGENNVTFGQTMLSVMMNNGDQYPNSNGISNDFVKIVNSMFPFTNIQIQNGIYDGLIIDKRVSLTPQDFLNYSSWNINNLFNCNFNGNIQGGNSTDIIQNISAVRLKRKTKDSNTWITLKEASVADGTIFEYADHYVPSGITQQYALVPVAPDGTEGSYEIKEVTPKWSTYCITIDNQSFMVYNQADYGSISNNRAYGSLTPIQSKYPIVIKNSQTDYLSGATTVSFIGQDYINTRQINRNQIVKEVRQFQQLINTTSALCLKDPNGWIVLCRPTSGDSISFSTNYGNGIPTVTINWVEQGEYDNEDDLNNLGIIDTK